MKQTVKWLGLAVLLAGMAVPQARAEWEMFSCPESGNELIWNGGQGMTYVGYRYVRRDGSTCSLFGSNDSLFAESDAESLTIKGWEDVPTSAKVKLKSKEYRIKREFYKQETGHYVVRRDANGEPLVGPDGTTLQDWVSDGWRYYYKDDKEYTGDSKDAEVKVAFADRADHPLLPWESETFSFTLTGAEIDAKVVNGAYAYKVAKVVEEENGDLTASVTITPGAKVKTPIDQNGVTGVLSNSGEGLAITFTDRWAKYYEGENLELEIDLQKNVGFWQNGSIYKAVQSIGAAPVIVIDVAQLPLKEPLKAGEQYHVKYRFHRANSAISTDEWSAAKETPKVAFDPKAPAESVAQAEAEEVQDPAQADGESIALAAE